MEKKNLYKFLYCISIFLIIGFCIRVGIDYTKYDINNNSAPFNIFIISRIIEFILPSVILFIISIVLKKKYGK